MRSKMVLPVDRHPWSLNHRTGEFTISLGSREKAEIPVSLFTLGGLRPGSPWPTSPQRTGTPRPAGRRWRGMSGRGNEHPRKINFGPCLSGPRFKCGGFCGGRRQSRKQYQRNFSALGVYRQSSPGEPLKTITWADSNASPQAFFQGPFDQVGLLTSEPCRSFNISSPRED
jgi:hypothetical protein